MSKTAVTENNARSRLLAKLRREFSGDSDAIIAAELARIPAAPMAPAACPEPATAFLCNVMRNGGSAVCARDRSETVAAIATCIVERHRSRKLVVGNDPRLAALPWGEAGLLPRFGSATDDDTVALSYARLAVAETGAVVTYTGRANPAANNLLPLTQLVVVDVADLVVSLEQAWQQIATHARSEGRPRGINFTAGPSSTADVAMQLVRGAHGPIHWHVILLGDVPANTLENARELAQ